ncbi:hypothetical protein M9Y10_027872 [Tritrichomonas musculus]|uniref:Uncharacterized protein n=1 Tax=Tritrichomonas musculus TaxID=1915356 RepID=A0ABR2GPG6_9EUKA
MELQKEYLNKDYQFLNRKRVLKIGFSYHDSLISNFCNKYYYFQNPVIILLKYIHQQVPKEEKVITVKTFYDYEVVEPNINDILTIYFLFHQKMVMKSQVSKYDIVIHS